MGTLYLLLQPLTVYSLKLMPKRHPQIYPINDLLDPPSRQDG